MFESIRRAETDAQPDVPSTASVFEIEDVPASRTRPIKMLIACGALLIAGIVVVTTILISDSHDRALSNSERELRNIALVLAEQADRTFQAVELMQGSVIERIGTLGITSREDFARRMSSYDVHLLLNDRTSGIPFVRGFSLIGTDGQLLNSSRYWPVPSLNIADRSYFQALKENPQLKSIISEPARARLSGSWTVYFGRRITAANGELLGVIAVIIDLEQLEKFFGSIALGEHSSISLFRSDGILLARHPNIESIIGKSFAGFSTALAGRDSGTTRILGRMQGKDRLIAAHRLANYPLVISAGFDVEEILAGWWHQAKILLGAGGAAALIIGGIVVLIVRQSLWAHRQAEGILLRQKQRLDTALNNMSQGLCMFDAEARLVVCNERYLQMYGLSSAAVKAGSSLVDLLHERRKAGNYSGDAEQYRSELLARVAHGKIESRLSETANGRVIQIVNRPMPGGGWVATHEDVTEQRVAERQIAHMARHDPLTDLGNRVLFMEMVDKALARLRRHGEGFAVHVLDLDDFKTVNDSLGHPMGDVLLKEVAARLRAATRETDTVARLGGDEFAILQTGVDDQREAAIILASRLLETIAPPFDLAGQQFIVGASIGIALAPEDGSAADQLLKNADLALYRVKAQGRNGFHFFEPAMEVQARLRHAQDVELQTAILRGEFEIFYQSVVDAVTQEPTGAEALLRWRHPERGTIGPAAFISLAEDTSLIIPLGESVLRKACEDATRWPSHVKLAVNLSPAQFRKGNLLDVITSALADSGLPPHRLELEVTETVLLQKNADNLTMLHAIKSLGISIVLDDFGAGHSSLSYLRMFPFDKVKIDRSLIAELSTHAESAAIICAITGLGKTLNVATAAVGVETQEQVALLRAAGCDEMQGYLFGRPCPVSELDLERERRDATMMTG